MKQNREFGRPVLIMAGGTGGHVFPALAVAEELVKAGVTVVWMGTRSGLEARVVPEEGFPIEWVRVRGLRGKGPVGLFTAPFMLLFAALQAVRILLKIRPCIVLGMGGYLTGPGGLVAWLLGYPLLIHEQNSVAGLTNRMLAPLARRRMEAFPGTLPPKYRPTHTGNPLRAAICALPPPEQRLAAHTGRLHLLVLGGSLGARVLNETLPAALERLAEHRRPEVWHQAGGATLEIARDRYRERGIEVRLTAFIDDVAQAYQWADLIICRAGAMTVAELAAAGVASVLVPYRFAVDDHQTGNARFLVNGGAARLIREDELTPETLAATLDELTARPGTLLDMAVNARRLAKPDAATRVAHECLQVAGVRTDCIGGPAG